MKREKDYIYIPEADMNEGLTSRSVAKVALYFTKNYIFVIPFESEHFWRSSKTEYNNAWEFITELNSKIETVSTEEFQNICIDFLPNERVYKTDALEKFKIQVGLLIFGGIQIKKYGEQLQSVNIQPRTLRAKLNDFYRNKL